MAVVASTAKEARGALDMAAARLTKAPGAAFSLPTGVMYAAGASQPGEVAFLFPGQGSQRINMSGDLCVSLETVRSAWDRHAAFPEAGEQRLHEVVFPIPKFSADEAAQDGDRLRATD